MERKKAANRMNMVINIALFFILAYYVFKNGLDLILAISLVLNVITNIITLTSEVKNND